jgi:hypothetical protein
MPIHEFLCTNKKCSTKTEKVFLTFKAAEGVDFIDCPRCGQKAGKQLSIPFPGHFHGSPEGYYKPSPCAKRIVNPDSISFESDEKKIVDY